MYTLYNNGKKQEAMSRGSIGLPPPPRNNSRGTFHFHSFQASFFLKTPPKTLGKQLVLEKNDG